MNKWHNNHSSLKENLDASEKMFYFRFTIILMKHLLQNWKHIFRVAFSLYATLSSQVIHMVSAANGAEDFYGTAGHKTRYENLEHARQLDQYSAQVRWMVQLWWGGNGVMVNGVLILNHWGKCVVRPTDFKKFPH